MSNEGTTEETVDEAPEASEPETEPGTARRRVGRSVLEWRLRNCVDALKELGVDPIALTDDGDDRDELLRSARDRGAKLVQHGKGLVEGDSRLRDETLRTVLGGAIDGEKSVVDVARRVARDLKNALERPGAAVVDDEAVRAKAKLSGMLHFRCELPPTGPTWGHVLAAVELSQQALCAIATEVGMNPTHDVGFVRTVDAMTIHDGVFKLNYRLRDAQLKLEALRAGKPQPTDNRRPDIDDDDEAVVQADVVGIKRLGLRTVSVKLKLVYAEDLHLLTLGRAWLRCNATEDAHL